MYKIHKKIVFTTILLLGLLAQVYCQQNETTAHVGKEIIQGQRNNDPGEAILGALFGVAALSTIALSTIAFVVIVFLIVFGSCCGMGIVAGVSALGLFCVGLIVNVTYNFVQDYGWILLATLLLVLLSGLFNG